MPPAAWTADESSLSPSAVDLEQPVGEDDMEEAPVERNSESIAPSRKRSTRKSRNVFDEEEEKEAIDSPTKKRRGNSDEQGKEHVSPDNNTMEVDLPSEKENNCRRSTGHRKKKASFSNEFNNAFVTRRNVNQQHKPPEAGIILRIYVENFMCHRKLTVDLCRNVNFIYGQNGSGKSAILAAIQICLGAGARRTNRARNLKELIREDTTSSCAKIRVTLLNKGDDAYEHDTYGDNITVERIIAKSGGYNGYRLYDVNMVEKSKSKKDLDEMLDKLNIQVENPVAILDQEEAKKFLTGKSSDKYNFFMKATELERIDASYRNAVEKVEEMEVQSGRLADAIEVDRELVEETKREVKKHQAIGKLELKKSKIEAQLAWSFYKENRSHLEKLEMDQEKFKAKADKKQQELTQAEAFSQQNDGENRHRDHLDALSKEAEESSEMKKSLEQNLKRAYEPQKAFKRQRNQLLEEKTKIEYSLFEANKILHEKRDEIAVRVGSADVEQARRNEVLRKAEESLASARAKNGALRQSVTDALKKYEDLEPQVLDAKQSVDQINNQIRGIQSRIESMKSSSANSLDVFGPRCAKVKKLVDHYIGQRRFSGPVFGPVGYYCKIQRGKEEFAAMAESALGPHVLDRFVVCNDADRKLLQSIRREAGCQSDCGVFQQAEHPKYNIPDPPRMEGIETIASVISISEDIVFNCLVDNGKIDERALARNKEQSEQQLLEKDSSGKNCIRGRKIKEVYFLPKGDCWKVTKNGNIQLVSNTRRMKQLIGVDMASAINEAKVEYENLKAELVALNLEYSKLEHEHTDWKRAWNKNKRAMQENEKSMSDAERKIEDIKAAESTTADMDTDTTVEEQDVAEAQESLDENRENIDKVNRAIAEKEPEIQEIRNKLVEVTQRNEKVLADLKEAESALTQFFSEVARQKEKIEKNRKKLDQYQVVIDAHSKGIIEARAAVESDLRNAKKLSYMHNMLAARRKERDEGKKGNMYTEESQVNQDECEPSDEVLASIPIPEGLDEMESSEYYEIRVNRAEEMIKQERKRTLNSSRDDLKTAIDKYVRAKEVFAAKMKQINEIEAASSRMKQDMALRQSRWRQFRDFISTYSGIKFDETLNIKGSSGTIEFDHANGSLDLIVQKDSANENSQQKDVKALSGGERSFATIALLLALGEMLETPFRVMDEFDVFLDPVTRKLIIDTLIAVGKGMSHRQFIFITPQDVSNVESSPNLKILKMKPPERREVAGGHTQQTLD